MDIDKLLFNLSKSTFRTSFKLKEKDKLYIEKKGMETIKNHAYDFISDRLKYLKENDGKQTPTKNHPVFIAQHATATCCRSCLEKWYKIKKDKILDDKEIELIVKVIMKWIEREYEK